MSSSTPSFKASRFSRSNPRPNATGENLQGLEDFTRLIDKRAASILDLPPPNVLILEANSLRENPTGPRSLNKNQFFKEPIKTDGYYFEPSGKPGMGYEYDEKFVVSRKRLA